MLIVAIAAVLCLCTVYGSPVADLSGTCGACREDWAFSIVPSCAHCTCQPKNDCVYAWNKGCVTASDIPCNVSLSSPYFEGSSSSALVYGNLLLTNCTNEFQFCLVSENCSLSYDKFLFQALIEDGQRSPVAYCENGGNCSAEFYTLALCADGVADRVNCTSDQDCPRFSHICDPVVKRCRPSTCCNNMTRLDCCRCEFGSLNATDFCNLYCSENYTTNPEVPFTCCSECGRVCNVSQCDRLLCPMDLQRIPVDGCCPECIGCQDELGAWHNASEIFNVGCRTCVCLPNGDILCEAGCQPLSCPVDLQTNTTGACCPTCRGCVGVLGEIRNVSDVWSNGCQQCVCLENGLISCLNITCPTPNCPQSAWITTSCCPICGVSHVAECRYHGSVFHVGDTWMDNSTCSQCTCSGSGSVTCKPHTCPKLKCPVYLQENVSGSCCPECMGCKDYEGVWWAEGEQWLNGCDSCFCYNGTVLCTKMFCPVPNCPAKDQHIPHGQCCPVCKGCSNNNETSAACNLLADLGLCQTEIPYPVAGVDNSGNGGNNGNGMGNNALRVQDICGGSCSCCESSDGKCVCDDNGIIYTLFGAYNIKSCKQLLSNPSVSCKNNYLGPLLKKMCPCECRE